MTSARQYLSENVTIFLFFWYQKITSDQQSPTAKLTDETSSSSPHFMTKYNFIKM